MLHASDVDRLFPFVAVGALAVYLTSVYAVYAVTPVTELVVLQGLERNAPLCASIILSTGLVFFCLPFVKVFRAGQHVARPSGIVTAAIVTMLVAIATNLLMCMCPTVVWVDPISKARVFALRWCEWIPLAGLMTFLSDAVDAPQQKAGLRPAILHSFSQVIAVVCGLVFPFCPDLKTWLLVQFISMVTYIPIFPRVGAKLKAMERHYQGLAYTAQENYHRRYFAYHLLRTCAVVWTILVVMYYVHVVWYLYFPEGHTLHFKASAMLVDTAFDVLAKCFYLKVILEVHQNVFDQEARRQRQLQELRRLMQVLWDSTTDTIVISVKDKDRASSFLSPSFQDLMGSAPKVRPEPPSLGSAGVMLETSTKLDGKAEDVEVFDARYIDSTHISSTDALERLTIAPIKQQSDLVRVAGYLIRSCWSRLGDENNDEASFVTVQEITKHDGEKCFCELKVCRKSPESFVALVRDVTERRRRVEAERRVHEEALARQRDAQSVNRFTRHEVKNGLLSGIELVDGIKDLIQNASNKDLTIQDKDQELKKMVRSCSEIDRVLNEILDTVLAEVMARDVIHECYEPQPKKTDILSTLQLTTGTEERFSLVCDDSRTMPPLMLDTQLLRHIHRNAISNACKYGKVGGTVSTHVSYREDESLLKVRVINDAGPDHAKLVQMGDEACRAVFESGKRLHGDLASFGDSSLSSGDGAWIMQKCAKNMQGACSIAFEEKRTVFTFSCHADPVDPASLEHVEQFELPPDTWALGIDDSWIQRKLILRIFANAGIHPHKRKVIGRDMAELEYTENLITEFLGSGPNVRVWVLIDENLDFAVQGEGRIIRSGSKMMEGILQKMPRSQKDRVLALVRSANDSAEDLALYSQRAHGFFSKTATSAEHILPMLQPLWDARFPKVDETPPPLTKLPSIALLGLDESDLEGDISTEELREVVGSVDALLEAKSFRDVPWSYLWSALHSLKGDIMGITGNDALHEAAWQINSMRGPQAPEDFDERWATIRPTIMDAINEMEQ